MLTNGMCRPRLKLAESSTGSFRSSGHARAAIVRGERERGLPHSPTTQLGCTWGRILVHLRHHLSWKKPAIGVGLFLLWTYGMQELNWRPRDDKLPGNGGSLNSRCLRMLPGAFFPMALSDTSGPEATIPWHRTTVSMGWNEEAFYHRMTSQP